MTFRCHCASCERRRAGDFCPLCLWTDLAWCGCCEDEGTLFELLRAVCERLARLVTGIDEVAL